MPRKPLMPTADDFFRVPSREPDVPAPSAAPPEAAPESPPEPPPEPASAAPAEKAEPRPRRARSPKPVASVPPDIAPATDSSAGALEKVTFYLPRSLLKSLEVVRVRVLMDHDVKITRSQIAEAVITTALADVDALERLVLDRVEGEKSSEV